jgi:aspartyl-tRNA(Asn)/glutamyl-tRNA(Gln) amidotransferase subunit C
VSKFDLTKEKLNRLAKLARLAVTESEGQDLRGQLTKVIDFFDQIQALDTDGVEPLITPAEIEDRFRDDAPESSSTAEEMVANAPSRQGSLFKVPPVV